jgi:hypothetical protein
MPDSVQRRELDAVPDASTISDLRDHAEADEVSIEAHFPTGDGVQKRLVVSPRGTVVLLNDVSEETFNRSTTADDVADSLRGR